MGEACSWHTNTPPTVYIHFRQNPVHSLKVRSINTVWCWNTTLRLLAGCLRSDLLLRGYCFHPSYYLWFGRNLHICFIPVYNIERYHIADKNNTKWLQCMLLHWYSSSCCQILRAKSNWIVITAVARPHKNDEEQCNGRASEQNFLTLLNYFAESHSWHARGNVSWIRWIYLTYPSSKCPEKGGGKTWLVIGQMICQPFSSDPIRFVNARH